MNRQDDLERIRLALAAALEVLPALATAPQEVRQKAGGRGPVTETDRALDRALKAILPQDGEGWLSEESADDLARLECRRVWIVDPLDGTEAFLAGIPEWCITIGLVEDGRAVAGGVCNPASGQTILGACGLGVTLDGQPVQTTTCCTAAEAVVLASRSEVRRGEWEPLAGAVSVRPTGSVAYKLGLVAAGLADATWTLVPKHEWDVAAGAALVKAAGGVVRTLAWDEPIFNQRVPKLAGLVATAKPLHDPIRSLLSGRRLLPT